MYSKPGYDLGHVKICLTCRETRDNLLFLGWVNVFNTRPHVVEVDLNRKVRRYFICHGNTATFRQTEEPRSHDVVSAVALTERKMHFRWQKMCQLLRVTSHRWQGLSSARSKQLLGIASPSIDNDDRPHNFKMSPDKPTPLKDSSSDSCTTSLWKRSWCNPRSRTVRPELQQTSSCWKPIWLTILTYLKWVVLVWSSNPSKAVPGIIHLKKKFAWPEQPHFMRRHRPFSLYIRLFSAVYWDRSHFFSADILGLISTHVIMVVDLNARNPLWSSQVTHAKGRKLEGIISDCNFNMPNRSLSDINFVKKTSRLNVYGRQRSRWRMVVIVPSLLLRQPGFLFWGATVCKEPVIKSASAPSEPNISRLYISLCKLKIAAGMKSSQLTRVADPRPIRSHIGLCPGILNYLGQKQHRYLHKKCLGGPRCCNLYFSKRIKHSRCWLYRRRPPAEWPTRSWKWHTSAHCVEQKRRHVTISEAQNPTERNSLTPLRYFLGNQLVYHFRRLSRWTDMKSDPKNCAKQFFLSDSPTHQTHHIRQLWRNGNSRPM